jgi:hypothetical protein
MAGFTDLVGNDGNKLDGVERRASPRYPVANTSACKGVRPGDGIEARLINISRHGILFEAAERLIPECTVYVRLIAADAVFMLRGRILRSKPSLLCNSNTIFESAVVFDGKTPISSRAGRGFEAEAQETLQRFGIESGSDQACARPPDEIVPPPTYLIRAMVPRTGPDLNQIFGLNNW